MDLRRVVSRSVSEVVAAANHFARPPEGLRVLMYHAIGTPALGDQRGLFSLSRERFRSHMSLLSTMEDVRVVELSRPELATSGGRVAITFDDGYLDNLEVAAPILSDLGFPFTVFVTSEFVRRSKPGFLSISALRELAALPGAQIGAHGANHVPLSSCDDQTLRAELMSSRHFLEDAIGREVIQLAYPFGAANRRVRDAALATGYQLGACSFAGINRPGRDVLLLARTEILAHDNSRVFAQKMRGHWDWYRWRTQDPACT